MHSLIDLRSSQIVVDILFESLYDSLQLLYFHFHQLIVTQFVFELGMLGPLLLDIFDNLPPFDNVFILKRDLWELYGKPIVLKLNFSFGPWVFEIVLCSFDCLRSPLLLEFAYFPWLAVFYRWKEYPALISIENASFACAGLFDRLVQSASHLEITSIIQIFKALWELYRFPGRLVQFRRPLDRQSLWKHKLGWTLISIFSRQIWNITFSRKFSVPLVKISIAFYSLEKLSISLINFAGLCAYLREICLVLTRSQVKVWGLIDL